ncbi:MAG: hypothetical protein M0Z99_25715 [Betaproteobacteria bacterium]|nr:hypothetical protein [Betaproteobacteria bacterium]
MAQQTRKPVKHRGKNLTDDAIEQVVRVIDSWSDKPLTWDALIDALVARLHYRYTRQALHKHERIKAAYTQRKTALAGADSPPRGSGQMVEATARIERLEAENQRLEAENQRLLEQFVTWAYNAHSRGLTKEFLSQPLPRVNRDQTLASAKRPTLPGKKRT